MEQISKSLSELLNKYGLMSTFSHVLEHNGDEFSSCNTSYNLDPDDFIITDGMTNSYVEAAYVIYDSTQRPENPVVHHVTEVVGSNYVIIGTAKDLSNYDLSLYINFNEVESLSKLDDVVKEIRRRIDQYHDSWCDMCYHIHEYRTKNVLRDGDPFVKGDS